VLKTVFFWVLYPLIRPFYLVSVILNTFVLAILIVLIAPFDKRRKFVHYIGRFWSILNICLSGTRLSIKGREKITKGQSYVIMSNHQSLFDVWALMGKMPIQLRWIIKSEIKKTPLFGFALERMGHIYVDRNTRKDVVRSLKAATQRIRAGASVVVFPEGSRSEDGRLQPFQRGGTVLAAMAGVSILPVTINGSRFALPKGTLALMPGRIQIVVGDLIDPAMFADNKKGALLNTVRSAIEENLDLAFGKLA